MFNSLWLRLKQWSVEGMHFPYLHDPSSGKPSITLLFLYLTFVLMFTSSVFLHFHPDLFVATVTTILIWTLSFVFYRMRRIDKFKIDLDDKEIEFDAGGDEDNGEEDKDK